MNVKILGAGCRKCVELSDNVLAAAKEANIEVDIDKLTDVIEIAQYGVMSTPGLVIDGKVVCKGRVPAVKEIGILLKSAS